ncbi:MAG: exodeoxyribonuclease I [Pseudomonadales bacterium]|jgi:exodeoxyribonuclease-1|nr:exodeoxyribonuclease I [Pseudomonadales bacterium]
MASLFWHDYETFGGDPRRDRPCQFAGLRTDLDLNPIGEPVMLYCQPAPDFLPDPTSCRITGIGPRRALAQGLREAEFCARILAEFRESATCAAGYNSLRFDDEISRNLFYRCLHDPYEREWKNGNSRWDIIDLVRMTQALRPEGIVWPQREDGLPSFRLPQITEANGIAHEAAHDAMSDVHATIAVARLIKQKQPKLYDFYFALRDKHRVLAQIDLAWHTPLVHVSQRFAAERGCLGIVLPLCKHPVNNNGIVSVDLLRDPAPWLQLDAAAIRERLYTRGADLAEGEERIGLKTIHINRCPALAPLNVLTPTVLERYRIDLAQVQARREQILAQPNLLEILREVFSEAAPASSDDPDLMLYSGGFFSDADRRLMQQAHTIAPPRLRELQARFQDPRLPELLFRFRARNYPATLDAQEAQRWRAHCAGRLRGEIPGAGLSMDAFTERLATETELPSSLAQELTDYARELAVRAGLAYP